MAFSRLEAQEPRRAADCSVRGRGRGRARRMGRHQFEWEASAGRGDGAWHAGDLDLAVIILNRTIILMANTNQRKLRGDNRATH